MICNDAFSQKFLEVPVKLEVEKGNFDGVIVKVKKDGKDAFTQDGSGKLRFKLDYNKKYSLVFTKPGYITKTIEFNTSAPEPRINAGFEPYKIGVKLFKQSDDENVVIYNQAVAKIKFDQTLDDFGFDTDYSKSILSAMNSPEEDNKEPEEEPSPESPEIVQQNTNTTSGPSNSTITAVNNPGASAVPPQANNNPEDNKAPKPISSVAQDNPVKTPPSGGENERQASKPLTGSEQRNTASVNGGDARKKSGKPESGSESNRNTTPSSGSEKANKHLQEGAGEDRPAVFYASTGGLESQRPLPQITEEERITMEEIVEKNRVITRVKISRGMKITEFSKVDYNWGATFYFKNNTTSISSNFFVLATGLID